MLHRRPWPHASFHVVLPATHEGGRERAACARAAPAAPWPSSSVTSAPWLAPTASSTSGPPPRVYHANGHGLARPLQRGDECFAVAAGRRLPHHRHGAGGDGEGGALLNVRQPGRTDWAFVIT